MTTRRWALYAGAALLAAHPRVAAGQTHQVSVAGHTLSLPAGFNIAVFAENLRGVRYLTLGPHNVVYASVPRDGNVVRLPDVNGDGVADSAVPYATGLTRPFGLAWRGDTLLVGDEDALLRIDPDGKRTQLAELPGGGNHVTRTVLLGRDNRIYVSIGSTCNVCDEPDNRRAAVMLFQPDGTHGRLFATGLRNSVGVAFNPATGELWGVNNDRDNLGDDVPPEHLNIIKDGKWYGWPKCYLPGKNNPEYPDAKCDAVEPPALTFQAHSAPLGLAFYGGSQFPADFKGDAFVTFHGSWNRSVPTGDKVIRVRIKDGKPVSSEDFVTGWQLPDGTRWGRVVGLLVLPDGSLLISDDAGGRIWRVTYAK
ncbi:MAG TPA: PQQ-dependent sugar dehydrogenase [Gemmatimonadales bacterium]|jgi:glucose/arabinose dehydrogenase|nr:PQQ-dependent sugar dehydrogenase [Gemmatimonadales bacterium]